VLALALPLLVAAGDPQGDVAPCQPGAGSDGAPDLIGARGEIAELGTSAVWTLTFAEPLRVPDTAGRPFRVDVVIRDPQAPTVDLGPYRELNRIVRFDALADPELAILLLPERAQNVFNPPRIEGGTMVIQVPGRTLSADEDETGTSPGLGELVWSVHVRDDAGCDALGDGVPSEPLGQRTSGVASSEDGVNVGGRLLGLLVLLVAGGLPYLIVRRRHRPD
jgi:hypothetical protein